MSNTKKTFITDVVKKKASRFDIVKAYLLRLPNKISTHTIVYFIFC